MSFRLPLFPLVFTSVHAAAHEGLPPSPVLRISKSSRRDGVLFSPMNFGTQLPDSSGSARFCDTHFIPPNVPSCEKYDVEMHYFDSYDSPDAIAPSTTSLQSQLSYEAADDGSWIFAPPFQYSVSAARDAPIDPPASIELPQQYPRRTTSPYLPSLPSHSTSQFLGLDVFNDVHNSFHSPPEPSWGTIPHYHQPYPEHADTTSPSSDSDDDPTPPGTPHQGFPPTSASEAHAERRCSQCDSTSTPLWRRHPTTQKYLCNACGLVCRQEPRPSPQVDIVAVYIAEREPIPTSNGKNARECSHCHTQTTPVWRRNADGEQVCNACGSYEKLRGKKRPLHLVARKFRPRLKFAE